MKATKFVPYSEVSFATIPGPATRFFRKFFLWQVWRFFRLNWKMMRIVVGGHS